MKKVFIILFFYLSSFSLWAQVTGFQKTARTQKLYTYFYQMEKTLDTGYIFIGEIANNPAADSFSVLLLKTDSLLNMQWAKEYILPNAGLLSHCLPATDGGYILSGRADTNSAIVKLDISGNVQWAKKYMSKSQIFALTKTIDNGYAMVGFIQNIGAGSNDVMLMKTDSVGNLKFLKTYGGTGAEQGWGLDQTSDGGFIMACSAVSGFGAGNYDMYLIKTDSNGNLQWSKTYGGTNEDQAYHVHQTTDGGFILFGYTTSFGAGFYDFYLIKTDGNGNLLWSKAFGGASNEYSYTLEQILYQDNGFTFTGETYSWGFGSYDVIALHTDTSGNLKWAMVYGSPSVEYPGIINQFNNADILINTSTYGFSANVRDEYIIKTNSLGKSGCNEMDVTDSITVMNVPTIITTPPTQVDSGWAQDTVNVIVVSQIWTEQTICSCNLTAAFTYSINNSQITCNNTSQNATNWLWSFGDGNFSTQQNPVYTYSVNGTYKVCLAASDTSGCSDSTCHTINITTGINEVTQDFNFDIYPNPATNHFTIEAKGHDIFSVCITNILCQKVSEIQFHKKTEVDVSSFGKGLFLVEVCLPRENEKRVICHTQKILIE